MPKRHTGTRAQALRKARAAKAARDARLAEREAQLTEALADFYAADHAATTLREAARAEADAILADAQARADRVRARADEQITTHDAERQRAITTLRHLGEPAASIATLTNLPTPEVRALLQAGKAASADSGV